MSSKTLTSLSFGKVGFNSHVVCQDDAIKCLKKRYRHIKNG